MRKIEKEMLSCIKNKESKVFGNMGVFLEHGWNNPFGPRSEIYLHGNHIADFWHNDGSIDVDRRTLRYWPTNTTISRLRALGVNVYKRKGVVHLCGKPILSRF